MAEDAPERLAYTRREGTGFPSASADHVFAVLARQLDAQMSDVDAADSKIGVILGFTAAVAVAPLALVAGAGGDVKTESLVLFGVGVGLFLVSALVLVKALAPSDWFYDVPSETFWGVAHEFPETDVKWWTAEMMTKGFERNLTRLQQKARWAKLGSRVLVGETLVVAVGLLVELS